jgi:NAD(P)-dependent dehydrogenase (short-subunit alcohol dehydrogenase family)
MNRIEGKVVLVTGSTAGLGKELARQFCRLGAKVVLNGRDFVKLKHTVSVLRDEGFFPEAVQGDVIMPDDCQRMVDHCIQVHGKLDILISNAGLSSGGRFLDTVPEAFRKLIEINTLGTIFITRAALPHVAKSRGSIIFISSLAGLVGLPYSSLYSSSKMALTAIAQSLRAEMAGSGVHVGVAHVGFLMNPPEKRIMGPDGNLQKPGKRFGVLQHSMEDAGKQVISMVRKRKRRKVFTFLGKCLDLAIRFTPWLVRWFMKKSARQAEEIYKPRS